MQIVTIRNTYKLTRQDLADLLGVSVKTISSWESGVRRPGPSAIRLIDILFNEEKYTFYKKKYKLEPKKKGFKKFLSFISGG